MPESVKSNFPFLMAVIESLGFIYQGFPSKENPHSVLKSVRPLANESTPINEGLFKEKAGTGDIPLVLRFANPEKRTFFSFPGAFCCERVNMGKKNDQSNTIDKMHVDCLAIGRMYVFSNIGMSLLIGDFKININFHIGTLVFI